MKTLNSALIVAAPSRIRDGLQALLKTMPALDPIDLIDSAAGVPEAVTQTGPDLVLFDANLSGDEIWLVIRQIKVKIPQTLCIAIVNNMQQKRMAQAAGADQILLAGFPAGELITILETALNKEEGQPGITQPGFISYAPPMYH
jgi:DNA-binding NarL/FixJ family response regulator